MGLPIVRCLNGHSNDTYGHTRILAFYKNVTVHNLRQKWLSHNFVLILLATIASNTSTTLLLENRDAFLSVSAISLTIAADVMSLVMISTYVYIYHCSMDLNKCGYFLYECMCLKPIDLLIACAFTLPILLNDLLNTLIIGTPYIGTLRIANRLGMLLLVLISYVLKRKRLKCMYGSVIVFTTLSIFMETECSDVNFQAFKTLKWIRFLGCVGAFAKPLLSNLNLVLLEMFLKKDGVELKMRLLQLGFWKMAVDILRLPSIDGSYIQEHGIFYEYTLHTWLYVFMRSASTILAYVCLWHFDSLGQSLQQHCGKLLGVQLALVWKNQFCPHSKVTLASGLIAVVLHYRSLKVPEDTKVTKPLTAWEKYYLERCGGSFLTLLVHFYVSYLCFWIIIYFNIGDWTRRILLQSAAPLIPVILVHFSLFHKLSFSPPVHVYRANVCICTVLLAVYIFAVCYSTFGNIIKHFNVVLI